jgi:predicted amidohydrolase
MELKENIKVTIGQVSHEGKFENQLLETKRLRYKEPEKQLEAMFKVIESAKNQNADFVLLPELFLPREYLYKHIKAICEETGIIIIGGLEYGPHWVPENDKTFPLINSAFIAIPYSISKGSTLDKTEPRYSTILETPKIFPADEEKYFIEKYGYKFLNGNKLYLFKSKSLGNWATLICVDFLNLPIQVLLQGELQTLFIVAYNQDVEYYVSLADSLHRVLLCNIIICNIGKFGGSLCYSPYRKPYLRNAYQVKGNNIDAFVTVQLPIKRIYLAQNEKNINSPIFQDEPRLIRKPPDYKKFKIVGN